MMTKLRKNDGTDVRYEQSHKQTNLSFEATAINNVSSASTME
jgi:hypothetical protein